jgi:hypothetical protein
VPVPVVWSSLKSSITTRASSRLVQWFRFRHSFCRRSLKDSMCPVFHGVPGGMYEIPIRSCRTTAAQSKQNSLRCQFEAPAAVRPTSRNALSLVGQQCAVSERSTTFSSDCLVCSSIIEAILIAFPSMVESNWKSTAHTTWGRRLRAADTQRTPGRVRG